MVIFDANGKLEYLYKHMCALPSCTIIYSACGFLHLADNKLHNYKGFFCCCCCEGGGGGGGRGENILDHELSRGQD